MAIRTYKTYTQSFSGDAPTLSDYNSFLEQISNDIASSKLALINSSTNDTFQSGHMYNISNNYYMSLYTGNETVLVEV